MRLFVLLTLTALLSAGCKSQCRVLSEKQCECTLTTSERTACLSAAANRETNNPPTEADEARCEALLDECDCNLLDTPEGKRACGFAN